MRVIVGMKWRAQQGLARTKKRAQKLWGQMLNQLAPSRETSKAVEFWAGLEDFASYYTEPSGIVRSQWLAQTLVPELKIDSLLEIGTNSGRNLAYIRATHRGMKLRGWDINARAIAFARKKNPEIDFDVANANEWPEPVGSWDAILTMSVLDHIPDQAVGKVIDNMVRTARLYVITVELWDGGHGTRDLYKYSRNMKDEFERRGVRTCRWEMSVGQYNTDLSPLYIYVGAVSAPVNS